MTYDIGDIVSALRVLSAFVPDKVGIEFVDPNTVCIRDHRLNGVSKTMDIYDTAELIERGL
jgi:hypothetical protein